MQWAPASKLTLYMCGVAIKHDAAKPVHINDDQWFSKCTVGPDKYNNHANLVVRSDIVNRQQGRRPLHYIWHSYVPHLSYWEMSIATMSLHLTLASRNFRTKGDLCH
jgi:hypothetical protein